MTSRCLSYADEHASRAQQAFVKVSRADAYGGSSALMYVRRTTRSMQRYCRNRRHKCRGVRREIVQRQEVLVDEEELPVN